MFADDNFNPATLPRIAREKSPSRRKELEWIRERRMTFFREYAQRVHHIIPAFTQMTSEVVEDEEYLTAMHNQMGVRGALIGIESFNTEGLEKTRKTWNPVGERMVNVIQAIQSHGIYILGSIITGLETDTPETLATMREFAKASKMLFAQFAMYRPFPGTVDFRKNTAKLLYEKYWLQPQVPRVIVEHPCMTAQELLRANQECWDSFYSIREIWKKAVRLPCSLTWKLIFVFSSRGFRSLYAGRGISADGARRKLGPLSRLLLTGVRRLLAFAFFQRQWKLRQKRELAA
jgi:radical SAM superfamily enzyme YgiQ (UPF0313 family)